MKSPRERPAEYTDDFEPDPKWEQLRDEYGEVVEGCYRTTPTPDSDNV